MAVQRKVEKMEDDLALERGDIPPKRKREKPKNEKQLKEEEMYKLALKVCCLAARLRTSLAAPLLCVPVCQLLQIHNRWQSEGTREWTFTSCAKARRSGRQIDHQEPCFAVQVEQTGCTRKGGWNQPPVPMHECVQARMHAITSSRITSSKSPPPSPQPESQVEKAAGWLRVQQKVLKEQALEATHNIQLPCGQNI